MAKGNPRICIRVNLTWKEWIYKQAEKEGISVSRLIRKALLLYFAEKRKDPSRKD